MKNTDVVSVRIPAELKAEWGHYCQVRNQSPSHAIRMVIRHLLKKELGSQQAQVSAHEPDDSRTRMEIRLTTSERIAAERIAAHLGTSPNKWITDLVRAYITHEPQLGIHELQVIGESNNQLRAIGRNLNQIALKMNRGDHGEEVAAVVDQIVSKVNKHTEGVYAVIRSNIERWRITWP